METSAELNQSKSKNVSNSNPSSNPQNPKPSQLQTRTREEGELSSSSDGGENPVSSATHSGGSVNPPALPGPISLPPLNKFNEGIQARKANSGINSTTSIDGQPQASVQPNNDKILEKNRVLLKSANLGWHPPLGTNTNLVISFSDDDSGSEPEDCRSEKILETKRNTVGVDGNQKVPSLLSGKSSQLQPTGRNLNKVMPKKVSLSRTFVSSTNKINGGARSRVAGSSSVDRGSKARNFNTVNRNFASQENGSDQGVVLNNTKLRDLRQQIALRERELKLKAAQQNKESTSVSGRDYTAINLGADAARKFNTIPDGGKLAVKEPNSKRLKVSGSYSTLLPLDKCHEILAAKSSTPLKEQASESYGVQCKIMTDHRQKGSPTRRMEASVKWKKQDDKGVNISFENPPNSLRDGLNINHIQIDRSTIQEDPCVLLNQSNPETNMNSSLLLKNTNTVELNHPAKSGDRLPGYFLKTPAGEQHSINGCEYHEGTSNDRTIEPSLDNVYQAPLNNLSLWNHAGSLSDSENSNIDMHSLVEVEESLDKELEEAQEHRRKCEIEERNALRAYRKAQRALVEANARCSELYHKRELYSSHFRSFILNDSSLLWSMRKHERVGIGLKHTDNASRNLELMPQPRHPKRPKYNGHNQPGYDSNIQSANGVPLNIPYRHGDGQNMGSEPCSEPDASTSEPMHHNSNGAANIVSSPSNDPNISADEDEETSPIDHATALPNYEIQQSEPNTVEREKDINHHSNNNVSITGSTNSLALEATLRSELFARFGKRILSKNSSSTNVEPADELGIENDNGSERTHTSKCSDPLSEPEKNQETDLRGDDHSLREISGGPVQIHCSKVQDNEYSATGQQSTTVVFSPASVLRSVFGHVKVISQFTSLGMQSRKIENVDPCVHNSETGSINSGDMQYGIFISSHMEESISDICNEETGSFTCDIAVDPFWPLCMYELRGKCNNDQCPWQHVRDFSNENVGQHPLGDSGSADFQVGLPLNNKKCKSGIIHNCQSMLTTPTYLVGLDILRAEPHSYQSVVTRKNGQCWRKCFSICLALSNLLQKDLPSDEPFLHGSDGRIEIQGSWDKQLSYFQSRNSIVNHLNQMLPTDVQALEMAFFMLSQEVNKLDGMKKALSVLSRAIEADPKSEILWITYLLIYYGNVKSVAKDDMFSHAVQQNDRSYGIWLMYINSRMCLEDRLVAYDAALTALCHHASAHDRDEYVSACILDLFLQMMDCLCISGNLEKAIQKINGLLHVATNSDQHHSLLISDILSCLTFSDKCMFWVCCVYLVIYRKIPEAVVHKFECDKEFLAIEWPNVHLLEEEKQRAVKLVEVAVSSVKLSVNSESLVSDADLRSAQYFGLCHIRFMVALDGIECCRSLLDEYKKLHPSCVEFALISAKIRMTHFEDLSLEGFEEALGNWLKKTPGIHCIWNQYIECALQKGDPDFAKELIVRWFDSFPEVQYPEKEISDAVGTCSSHRSLELASASNPDILAHNLSQMDTVFGYLNLSLAKLLHNDHIEARNAIDRALKAATPPFFKHCLIEHAMFLLTYESQLKGASFREQLNILKGYLDDALTFPVSEPLSRRFINKIEKPRVRQLIDKILSPVLADFSTVNLVLEVWYGPSLLPQKFGDPKELVDFVEAIFEIVPSNYQLAISVCNLLRRGDNFVDVSFNTSMLYWACSTLINAIFHAIPIAPEYVWVDTANILDGIAGIESISERFYKRALTVYPFSIKLWNCYHKLSKTRGDTSSVVEAAREKGMILT